MRVVRARFGQRALPRIVLATLGAEAFVVPPPMFDRLVGRAASR